jgi:hypothetical protein
VDTRVAGGLERVPARHRRLLSADRLADVRRESRALRAEPARLWLDEPRSGGCGGGARGAGCPPRRPARRRQPAGCGSVGVQPSRRQHGRAVDQRPDVAPGRRLRRRRRRGGPERSRGAHLRPHAAGASVEGGDPIAAGRLDDLLVGDASARALSAVVRHEERRRRVARRCRVSCAEVPDARDDAGRRPLALSLHARAAYRLRQRARVPRPRVHVAGGLPARRRGDPAPQARP